jgi:hypothetical protein
LERVEARNEEAKEQNIKVGKKEINNEFLKYQERLNRLNMLDISKELRERFYKYFLATAREILKVTEERINVSDKWTKEESNTIKDEDEKRIPYNIEKHLGTLDRIEDRIQELPIGLHKEHPRTHEP